MDISIFNEWESEVRGYIRSFPIALNTAHGSFKIGEDGINYLDFFAGPATLN